MYEKSIDQSSGQYLWRFLLALAVISSFVFCYQSFDERSSKDDSGSHRMFRWRRSTDETNSSDGEQAQRRLPKAIIIGVKKGGTRALLEYLRMHPDVKAPGPEVHFFDRFYHLGSDWYRHQMPSTTSRQVAIEKTPSYFVTKEAPARLRSFDPNVKLIVVLRNPVTRALSDYAQNAAKRAAMPSFEQLAFINLTSPNCLNFNSSRLNSFGSSPDFCNGSESIGENGLKLVVNTSWGGVKIGLYHRYVNRWLKYFDLNRVHFVSGERLVTHPAAETNAVERFLGLRPWISHDHFVYPDLIKSVRKFPCLRRKRDSDRPRCLGKTKGRNHPKVDDELLRILEDFYRPHNEKLYDLIGRKFEW